MHPMKEVNLEEVIENASGMSRHFQVITDPKIIGKITMREIRGHEAASGIVETKRPCPSEIPITKPLYRPIEVSKLLEEDACIELVLATLRNSGYFQGYI